MVVPFQQPLPFLSSSQTHFGYAWECICKSWSQPGSGQFWDRTRISIPGDDSCSENSPCISGVDIWAGPCSIGRQLFCSGVCQQTWRPSLSQLVIVIFVWTKTHIINFTVRLTQGRQVVVADQPSLHHQIIQMKWLLFPWVCDEICKVYRRLMVDLFTTRRN